MGRSSKEKEPKTEQTTEPETIVKVPFVFNRYVRYNGETIGAGQAVEVTESEAAEFTAARIGKRVG